MTLLEQIDHWALVTPEKIAHVSGDRTLTYGELRTRSDALAAHLQERFGTDRSPIAVLGHREPEMLIAFLGAAKSGRPYVPLDTALPAARIDQILATANAALTLTPDEIARFSASSASPPPNPVAGDAPFYILFTSGSSGTPKGVVITRSCLEHFVTWMIAEQHFGPHETFLNQAPFSFDLSVMDLYCSLATGGTLFSVSRDLVANPRELYRALAGSGVTTWVSTPSFAQMCLVERTFSASMLPEVERFLFCGETLAPETATALLARFPLAQVWNTYGPTEATVATTSVRVDAMVLGKYSPLPVGRTMPGTNIFIVDAQGATLPESQRGEIVIAGPNVSPGYLGRPDLNARVFFTQDGQRAYRTGDWGRFRDGLLFFEGRIDGQVKVNGYRIELGDIEANLRALPLVRDAVVLPVVKNGACQSLAAFIILAGPPVEDEFMLSSGLKTALASRVPAYMVPRKFRFLDAFPMTANGKADRRELAAAL